MFSGLFVLSVALLASEAFAGTVGPAEGIIVLSFDGFNDEYLEKITSLSKTGSIGKDSACPGKMESVNVTETLATHHTVSMGVLPNVHGVIANHMFDAAGKEIFNSKEQYTYNKSLQPIWVKSRSKGIKSACMMWPGCDAIYNNEKADIHVAYNPSMPWTKRIDQIVEWAVGDKADLILGYFEDNPNVDVIDTTNTDDIIKKVGAAIQYLQDKLNAANHSDDFDIIIMSDHGTKIVTKENIFNIDKFVSPSEFDVIASGPIAFIRATSGNIGTLYAHLKDCDMNGDNKKDNGTLYFVSKYDETLMEKYNLINFPLLKDVLIFTSLDNYAFYETDYFNKVQAIGKIRENGYEKEDDDMDGILVLKGPTFNTIHDNSVAQIVDVYPLLAQMMDIDTDADTKAFLGGTLKVFVEPDTLKTWEL